MVVAYKMSNLGYAIISRMAKVDHIALPNLLLGERVAPEFLQDAASAERLADELQQLLDDPARRTAIRERFAQLHQLLAKGASEVAARTVLQLVSSS